MDAHSQLPRLDRQKANSVTPKIRRWHGQGKTPFQQAGRGANLGHLFVMEEDKVMKHLLIVLEANGKGTKQWAAKLYVKMEDRWHHVQEEEGLLEKRMKVFSQAEAEEIGLEIQAFNHGKSSDPAPAPKKQSESQNEKKP